MNNTNYTRLVVNFILSIFVFVILLIVILLLLYYLTPNNYSLEIMDESKLVLIKNYSIKIEAGSDYTINSEDSDNYLIKILPSANLTQLEILIKNSFKSQNIIYTNDKFIKTKFNSYIIIPNKSDKNIEMSIMLYQ